MRSPAAFRPLVHDSPIRRIAALALGVVLGALGGCVHGRGAPPPVLRIIGTNDFHGGLEARPNGNAGLWGGAAALAGAIARARAECVAPACYSLLVDAGDEYQGQASSSLARGAPVSQIFNHMGFDVAALGNHDLDWGRDTLRMRLAEQHYPVLSANLRDTNGRPVDWMRADTIVHRGPFAIGVIGIMTVDAATAIAASNLVGIQFVDPVPIVDSLVRDLRMRGANVVIVVAHAGGDCEANGTEGCRGEIINDARRFSQPINAIIAGHRHVRLDTEVKGTPITGARTAGQALDLIDLARGAPARHAVRDVYVDSVVPDSAVARMVAAAVAAVGPRLAEPVTAIADDMIQRDAGEFPLGDLVADAYRAAGQADLAAVNHAGVRAPLHTGTATYGALFDVQPFGNHLVKITARGASIRRYFETLVSRAMPGGFISGATVTVDRTRPSGSRVIAVDSGRPLDDAAVYTIVINDFMQTGGDSLAFPDPAAHAELLAGTDLERTIAYLRTLPSPVHAPAANRWVIKP